MQIGRLAARAVIGSLFVGHGTQKLFGWFGGPGFDGTVGMMKALRMHPVRRNALAVGITETAGGALLIAGLATPAAAAGLVGTMITAIRTVHFPNGLWVSKNGYEYNAVLIGALAALVEAGPGKLSLDAALGHEEWGTKWAVGALATGAAASAIAVRAGRRAAAAAAARDDATGSRLP